MKKKMIISVILLILIIGGISTYLIIGKNSETKKEINNDYQIYINGDSLIKIDIKETYTECTNKKETKICSDKNIEITNITGLEENAKELLKEEITYQDLTDLLNKLVNKSNKDVTIFTNYETKELKTFKNGNKKIAIIKQESLTDEEMLKTFEENIKYYTVTFDTDGGSPIDSIVVKEKDKVKKPDTPTKEGFSFKEWQVDNKTYDFESEVTSNLEIKATWKKKASTNTNTESNNTGSNNQNQNSNNNQLGSTTINLNDNIIVVERYAGIICGFGMFATNLKEVFPNTTINGYRVQYCPFEKNVCGSAEIADEALNENISKINFNTTKENNAKQILESINTKNVTGIDSFKYKIENHRYSYDLYYLDVVDGSFKTDGMIAASKIKSAFAGAYNFPGPCGSGYEINTILDEKICAKYNLKCSRW